MKVLAIKRNPLKNVDQNVDFIGNLESLNNVLRKADYVSINLPLTKQTRGVLGKEEIELLKPNAYVINTSRSEIMDNAALLTALEQRSIAGALLDVYDENLRISLSKLDNVILTPHIAGTTLQSLNRGIQIINDNIRRFMNGRELLNQISLENEY
jgi:phosphoglycerate dehydrogenase-like enzyme